MPSLGKMENQLGGIKNVVPSVGPRASTKKLRELESEIKRLRDEVVDLRACFDDIMGLVQTFGTDREKQTFLAKPKGPETPTATEPFWTDFMG